MTLTCESLPNEIWLTVFTYLSSRHIWRAFFGINKRLNQLLTSDLIHHTIDLRDTSYSEIVELLGDHDNNSHDRQWQAKLVSHAYAIRFENKFDLETLIDGWILTKTNWHLSSLRIIHISSEAVFSIHSLLREMKFKTSFESQIHCLYLVFDDPSYHYQSVLSNIIEERISCPIMILEVKRGHQYLDCKRRADLHDMKYELHWTRTIRLTISLQHASELILLFMPDALPLLEHLNVTIEQPEKNLISTSDQSTKRLELCEKDLRRANADSTKLRSLVLHQIELDDLVILFNLFTFSLLHSLTLVDVYDSSLANLPVFQQSISSSSLPSLKHDQFQFLLRFPANCEHEWICRYHNHRWPFDNTDFHVAELVELRDYHFQSDALQAVLLIYSVPFDSFTHMRTVHNHEFFTPRSTLVRKNFVCENLEWLWKWTGNKTQLMTSLKAMRNVQNLRCLAVGINNQPEIVKCPKQYDMCHHLRSLTFRFKQHLPYKSSQHCSPLQLILDVSPHLFHLDVSWKDLLGCSGRYPMITHVHLTMHGWHRPDDDVTRFNILIPKVRYLAIGGQQLIIEKRMIDFVSKLLIDDVRFRDSILLQINKNGRVGLKPRVKANTKEAIRTKIDRLQDQITTRIEFSYYNQLNIWLR